MQRDNMSAKPIRLVVGLGNPGAEYEKTRHNAGVWFVDKIGKDLRSPLTPQANFFGSLGKVTIGNCSIHLLIPGTYMNDSGRSVLAVAQFFKLSTAEILVAHDDLDHDAGSAKLKFSGGYGGHNGLRDIARVFSSGEFARLRLGIGHPGDRSKVTPFVLGAPSKDDRDAIAHAITLAYKVMPDLVLGEWNRAVKKLHDQIIK
jgi:peptidyl-tRNA hydrolase, PTH1 family